MSKTDFFFGEITKSGSFAKAHLSDLNEAAKRVSPSFFTAQLNRIMRENGGRLIVSDGTSSPSFFPLLDKIAQEGIGFIDIYAANDVNQNVEATLACDILLDEGVINVKAHWCAYKDIRAEEIISTLLVPIHLKSLEEKTCIRWDSGKLTPLVQQCDYQTELKNIYLLSKYPSETEYKYTVNLECAGRVSTLGLSGEQALNAYYELLHRSKQ